MRILYLCDEYPPGRHGGIGSVVRMQAREMVKMGHNVVVAGYYSWGYGGDDEFDDGGVKVYRFRRRIYFPSLRYNDSIAVRIVYRLFKAIGIWQWDIERSLKEYGAFLETLIRKHSIDIVEMPDFNDYVQYCNRYIAFPRLSVPVIVKMHGCLTYIYRENNMPAPEHVRQMELDILNQASGVCSVSKYNATKTAEYLGYIGEVKVLYNGLELPELNSNFEKIAGKVIFTGTLTENKGIYQLMDAWNMVHSKNPEARLNIYGKGPVEKVKTYLSEEARKTVVFHGHVQRQELFKELATSMVAVFPSVAESFSLAPMEAMVCKTAVIFTKRTSGPELITENVNGLLIDPFNAEEIAEKICYLLDREDICYQMGEEGKNHIIRNFTIERVMDHNLSFYKTVLASVTANNNSNAG